MILVVEDEFIVARDLQNILVREGYDVVINVKTMSKAIEIINEASPSLVLIDINLTFHQEREGIKIAHYLLDLDKIPYIYITSLSDKRTLDEVKDTRPFGYIVKPFKPIDVITTVSIVLSNYKHRLIEPVREEASIESEAPFIIKKAVSYINDNITEKITLEELVDLTKWNSSHFIKVFTQHLGVTPYQFILQRKIERAKTLLEETDMSSGDIAFQLGFGGYSNFFTAFKKHAGMTPDEYRKMKQVERRIK